MPQPTGQPKPTNVRTQIVKDVSGAGIGDVLTYTVPAGMAAVIRGASWVLTAGVAPILALRLTVGGVVVTVSAAAAQGVTGFTAWLAAGETCIWRVTTLGAGATLDATIVVEESAVV